MIGGNGPSVWSRAPQWPEIAELFVAFGGIASKNAEVNPGGVARHTTVEWQRRCRARGTRFVNVGPCRGDADQALDAEWLALRPNTDVALILGLGHSIVASGREDRDFLGRCCVGFGRFRSYVMGDLDGEPKDAGWATTITGIDAGQIVDLVDRIASQRTIINLSWSIQRADHEVETYIPVARFTDIVFPIATALERNDFAAGTLDLSLTAMHRAVSPPEGIRADYEVFAGLAERLGFHERFTEGRDADAWVRELYESGRCVTTRSPIPSRRRRDESRSSRTPSRGSGTTIVPGTSRLAQGSTAQTTLVEVEPIAREIDPADAWRPPLIDRSRRRALPPRGRGFGKRSSRGVPGPSRVGY